MSLVQISWLNEQVDQDTTDQVDVEGVGSLSDGTLYLVKCSASQLTLDVLSAPTSKTFTLVKSSVVPTAICCAGPAVFVGDDCGQLHVYNADVVVSRGYLLPVLSLSLRAAAVLSIVCGFERHLLSDAAAAVPDPSVPSSLLDSVSLRQVLDSIWLLHANAEVVSLNWADMCAPPPPQSVHMASTGPIPPSSSAAQHIRWTLASSLFFGYVRALAVLNPPMRSLFGARERPAAQFAFARDDRTGSTPAAGTMFARDTHGHGTGALQTGVGDTEEEDAEPALVLVTAGGRPLLATYRVPLQRQTQTLSELAANVSYSLQRTARSMARELKAAIPTPFKRGLAGGLHQLGAGGLLSALSAWVNTPDYEAGGGTVGSAVELPPPLPAVWSGTARAQDDDMQAEAEGGEGEGLPVLRSPPALPRIADQGSDFPDADRSARCVCADPLGRYLLLSDGWGRVMLFDCEAGGELSLVRLRKGVRDAQVGWLLGPDDDANGRGGVRLVLYWVVYSPNRGTLDVWRGVHGCRIASHTVGRGARMLYTSGSTMAMHGMPGMPSLAKPLLTGWPRCVLLMPIVNGSADSSASGDAGAFPGLVMANAGDAGCALPPAGYARVLEVLPPGARGH